MFVENAVSAGTGEGREVEELLQRRSIRLSLPLGHGAGLPQLYRLALHATGKEVCASPTILSPANYPQTILTKCSRDLPTRSP